MGESFFSPCTRHVSMYLRPGIVILKFFLSHGVLFLLVSSAIDVATAVGWCPIDWVFVRAMVTADGLHRDALRAMVTADGTHAPWLRRDVHARRPYVQWLQQMGCIETLYVRWLQQIYSRWNTCTVVATRRACLAKPRARPEFAVYSALNSCT
jgi:hypothetical protein